MPCELKEHCTCRPKNVECQFWYPSKHSKYFNCAQWIAAKKRCHVEGSPCHECDFYVAPEARPIGDTEKLRQQRNKRYYVLRRQESRMKRELKEWENAM